MTSGVYQLTFTSGNTYIGKSINIENRWKQHFDKLSKGCAAANMQAEFDKYGYPEGKTVFECHPDHIDIVEACFINRLKPVLNGTYPPDPFIGFYDVAYDGLMDMLHMSTTEHVAKLYEAKDANIEATTQIDKLKRQVDALLVKRSREEIRSDINKRIEAYTNCIEEREASIDKLTDLNKALAARLAYANKPWWEKLFS